MKKFLSLILSICLLVGILPTQAKAFAGDILAADSGAVQQRTLSSGSLVLQNDYLRVIARKDGTLSTAPAADSADPTDRQTPFCEFITYGTNHTTHPASLRLKSLKFVDRTPNGQAKAIHAEYDLTVDLGKLTVSGTTSVYYEIVQLKEEASAKDDTWGVLVSVDNVKLNEQDSEKFFQTLNTDVEVLWGYTLDGFTGMGHRNAADSPVIKMSHTVYDYDEQAVLSTGNSVITGKVENISTWESFSQGGNWCYDYITEVYTDGYAWANPFVGLSEYYKNSSIRSYLPDTFSVTPASRPGNTRVECVNDVGLRFQDDSTGENPQRFLWGFRNLVAGEEQVPTAPDMVDPTIYAKRLAAFAVNGGVTVEYVADDAALETLKKQYGEPVALINGDYESKNGADFTFTGGAALLSPSVTATWGTDGKLVIKKDGTIEQSGVHLCAPTFKFYQPKDGATDELKISLTDKGFAFAIAPEKNNAIIYVDIPYATVQLENATADAAGNLVFGGEIGFQTVFNGAEFSLEKLGYGLNEKNEFKVNGVHATGSFDTAKLMTLELASVEGEVNTFKGEEKYAFSLELNAFDLFETEAQLALERSKKDGSLIPDELWFYVKSSPGIPLIPPIPIGQLNGGGAGFMDLAATVNGDYFAIPPLKLRGALTGTYLHLIEGTGNVVLGPSEISLKATDVGLVGVGKAGQIIDSFGYSMKLNGQERNYRGTIYKGIYFVGSEELALNLPNNTINIIALDSSVKLGAFGGANAAKDTVYLGIGSNGTVKGRVQIPESIRYIGGLGVDAANINLIIGGQTTLPIRDTSVSEGMKQAFENVDVYLGAMTQVGGWLVSARAWVLVPQIVKTDFRMGDGWDIEVKAFGYMSEWDWSEKGVEPVVYSAPLENGEESVSSGDFSLSGTVYSAPLENGEENAVALLTAESLAPENGGGNTQKIQVNAGPDETPYILLAFNNTVTEQQIKDVLSIKKQGENNSIVIRWVGEDGQIDPDAAINADIDLLKNNADEESYRVAMLRLSEGGSYEVGTGSLAFVEAKSKGFAVTPFEKLNLSLGSYQVSGEINYAVENTKYVLRTYLSTEKGGADYLIDEQTVANPDEISVAIPANGTLAPTGEYYVTTFLMMEKEADLDNDGEMEKALAAIDSQQFSDMISYTNTQQPNAPASVTLKATGNEVMKAEWTAVNNASGYRVTIYQQDDDGKWINTGFGYDVDGNTTSIDMALTVGGNGISVEGNAVTSNPAENLSANETYKVGVSTYKETEDGAKYYSAEAESSDAYLPEYTPLSMTLSVNDTECKPDENGVYHAYVDGTDDALTVSCETKGVTYKVTRMDTNDEIAKDTESTGYAIPTFEGSLMFKIDGISGQDVTSVFLLVSVDKTAPVLTLSDPIFYADMTTGAYEITGTADAGSEILYGGSEPVYAAGNGSFTISGTLEEEMNSGVLSLCAQDSVGNRSKQQLALVTRQEAEHSVTVKTDGNGAASASPFSAAAGTEITLTATPNTGYHFKEWQVISGGVSITNGKFIMPDSNVEVKAIFEEDAPPTPAEFIVTFDGNGGTPSVGIMTTTKQKLTALPEASRSGSYSFDGWYTEKSGGTKITTDTVFSANTTVYAHWTYTGGSSGYSCYTIKATAGAGGSISPYGSVGVREGRNQTFTITPDKGYAVSDVKIDGESIGAVKSYTFENVSRTHTIEVIFMKANSTPQATPQETPQETPQATPQETPQETPQPVQPVTPRRTASPASAGSKEYKVMEGADGTFSIGEDESLTIRVDAELSRFTGVEIDGREVDPASYTTWSGSTYVKLTKEFLSALALGGHTVKILFSDGYAITTISIVKSEQQDSGAATPAPTTAPSEEITIPAGNTDTTASQTAESTTSAMPYAALAVIIVICGAALVIVCVVRRKEDS